MIVTAHDRAAPRDARIQEHGVTGTGGERLFVPGLAQGWYLMVAELDDGRGERNKSASLRVGVLCWPRADPSPAEDFPS